MSTGSHFRSAVLPASSRLASRISSTSASSSWMLRRTSPACSGRSPGLSSISSTAIRMRASGERSSCDALASSRRCACSSASCRVTRVSIRSAARLKLRASWATSSRPCTSTRACRLPAACASTERCSVSSRRVIRRDTGHAASATARNSIGRATGPPIHGRGGMGRQVRISSVRSSGNATRCTTPVMPRPPRRGKSPLCPGPGSIGSASGGGGGGIPSPALSPGADEPSARNGRPAAASTRPRASTTCRSTRSRRCQRDSVSCSRPTPSVAAGTTSAASSSVKRLSWASVRLSSRHCQKNATAAPTSNRLASNDRKMVTESRRMHPPDRKARSGRRTGASPAACTQTLHTQTLHTQTLRTQTLRTQTLRTQTQHARTQNARTLHTRTLYA